MKLKAVNHHIVDYPNRQYLKYATYLDTFVLVTLICVELTKETSIQERDQSALRKIIKETITL